MIPTPEQAYALLCEYNEGDFHREHGRVVGGVMRWYARELGYGDQADFWQTVGILHDLDFERWPDQHCIKEQQLLRDAGVDETVIHAVASHGWGLVRLKSLRKKFKTAKFAAGCSREVITRGAELLGWDLDTLMDRTLTAMKKMAQSE